MYTFITMIYISTITQKGQVTLPVDIRKFLGVHPYEKVAFKKVVHTITLSRAHNFLSLKGSIKSKKHYSDDEADLSVLKLIKKEYEDAAA